MKSMTGFGRSSNRQVKGSKVALDVSIRAVNGRYPETRFHLPQRICASRQISKV